MLWLIRNLRYARRLLQVGDTPRQIAAGMACGLLLGLLPKGNLLAAAVASCLLATRMSVAAGLLCALAVSLVAPLCDPITHRTGAWILTQPALIPLWRTLTRLPFAAWTALNNTVVMGSLVWGLVLAAPVYRLSLPWIERWQARRAGTAKSWQAADEVVQEQPLRIGPQSEARPLRTATATPPHVHARRSPSGSGRRCA